MSAVRDPAKEREREQRGRFPWPWSWACPLFYEPLPLIAYVAGVLACYLAFTGWEATHTPVTAGDFALFSALMCCGACCVEASGRLGQPTGVWRDLLSAWWLPVALLLPPLYALAAPSALGLLSYLRVYIHLRTRGGYLRGHSGTVYRSVFSCAALGLSGAF